MELRLRGTSMREERGEHCSNHDREGAVLSQGSGVERSG